MYYSFWSLYGDGTITQQKLYHYRTPRMKIYGGLKPRFRAFAPSYNEFLDSFDRRGIDLPDELSTADAALITLYDVYEACGILYTHVIVAEFMCGGVSAARDVIIQSLISEHSNEFHTLQYWHNKIAAGTIAYIESL